MARISRVDSDSDEEQALAYVHLARIAGNAIATEDEDDILNIITEDEASEEEVYDPIDGTATKNVELYTGKFKTLSFVDDFG